MTGTATAQNENSRRIAQLTADFRQLEDFCHRWKHEPEMEAPPLKAYLHGIEQIGEVRQQIRALRGAPPLSRYTY